MRFGDYELDLARFELRRGGGRIRVQPRVLDLLVYLIRNHERVVSKEELLDRVWRGVAVSETALTHAVKEARRAVRDDGDRQAVIQTVRGRGYRFVARLEEPDESAAEQGSDPFVGRDAVLSYLEQELRAMEGGRCRAVFLTGEPGIGKSRTAAEFLASAREHGARVLVGRCVEGQGAPAHWPWTQVVRSALQRGLVDAQRDLPGEGAAILASALPGLEEELGERPPHPAPLQDEEARFRVAHVLAGLLASLAERAPLVVLLDDLHCADPSSLKLLSSLLDGVRRARILLLGTYRETEVARDPVRSKLLGSIARRPGAHTLLLEGLARADVRRLLEAVHESPVEPPLLDSLHRRTGGNPFFLTQIIQVWAVSGAVADAQVPLPRGVREAIGHHLDILSESCRDLLSRASVIGREFELDVLAEVSGVGVDDILETLESAIDARVVRVVGDAWTRCEFVHALIPETLYDAMSTARRLRLHGRVGLALEALRGDDPSRATELAHHFQLATSLGHADAARRWSVRAAELAARQLAYDEAVFHYKQALEARRLLGSEPFGRLELLLALAEAQARAGEVADARQTYQRTADLAREHGDFETLARAALGLDWDVVRRGAFGTDALRLALLREALAGLKEEETSLRVRLLAALDEALYFEDEPRTGPSPSREAVDMARRIADPDALAFALNRRHLVLRNPTGLDERLALSRELVHLAGRRREPDLVFDAYGSQIQDALERGDLELVDSALGTFERLANEYGIPKYLWYADLYRAMRELLAGRFAEAEPRIARAFSIGSRVQADLARLWHVAQMQALRLDQGRAEAFLPELREVAELYPVEAMRLNLALLEALTGDEVAARRMLDRVGERGLSTLRRDMNWMLVATLLSQLCDVCRHREAAAILYDALRPFERQHVVIGTAIVYRGAVATELGRLAALLGRPDEAERHFETALLRERRMGARPFEAAAQLAWARMLVERGEPCRSEEAARRLQEASSLASELGAHRIQREVLQLDDRRGP